MYTANYGPSPSMLKNLDFLTYNWPLNGTKEMQPLIILPGFFHQVTWTSLSHLVRLLIL